MKNQMNSKCFLSVPKEYNWFYVRQKSRFLLMMGTVKINEIQNFLKKYVF